MKRKRKLSIFALMLVLTMCMSLVTAHAAPDYKMTIPASSGTIFNGSVGTNIKVTGTLTAMKPNKTYTFTIKENGSVEIYNYSSYDIPFCILDQQGYVLASENLLVQPGFDYYRVYLMAGTYMLFVGTEYPTGVDQIEYDLRLNIYPTYEDFPESPKKNNDTPDNADPMVLIKGVSGILCANEACQMKEKLSYPATDFYKFEVASDKDQSQTIKVDLTYTGPIKLYILKSDKNIVAYQPENLFEPVGGAVYKHFTDEFTLEAGVYYLGIEAKYECGSSYYNVSLKDVSRTTVYDYFGTFYTTIGESAQIFNKFDAAPLVVTDHWESFRPDVAEVTKLNDVNSVVGKKVGKTVIYGYPVKNGFSNSLIKLNAVVEFDDVLHTNKKYYYDAVYWAVDYGITAGYKDKNGDFTTFKPENECSRGQIVSFLWRMRGCPEPKKKPTYSDVKEGDYFYKAVAWAEEQGITGGYKDGTFRPQDPCTRAQIVSFLWRMAGTPEPTNNPSFSDVKNKNAYYYKAVAWADEAGITGGYKDGTFRPDNKCSRAQTVTFLYRYNEAYGGKG